MLKTFLSKPLLFLLVFAFSITEIAAQSYSYIYIQGDKQTPFYVKLEGDMLPRYGKNYCIIPKLVAGEVNIDILFQQNAYPAQHFIIQVPENGYRGFMLTQRNGQFALYDLQQQFYLQAGNAATDDHMPLFNAGQTPPPPPVTVAAAAVPAATVPSEPPAANDTPQPAKTAQPETTTTTQAKPANDGQPKFLDNIELSNDHNGAGNVATAVVAGAAVAGTTVRPAAGNNTDGDSSAAAPAESAAPVAATPADNTPKAAVINSDCPDPISEATFQAIYQKVMAQPSEESRLGYLNQQIGGCFTTKQVGALARTMDSDAARYTFLKKMYPRTTDQAAYAGLDELFTDAQWKAYFQQLVKR